MIGIIDKTILLIGENIKYEKNIWDYIENNLKGFEFEGVEITDEDVDWIEEKINKGMSLENACDECLQGIRDCLDAGLDDESDNED